jgi:protein-S-isoprenylcysteine O-methyltransferase Ste14
LLAVYAFVFVVHLVVPGRWVEGYVRDPVTNRPLRYRLNGLRVMLVVVAVYVVLGRTGLVPWDVFWVHRWPMAFAACAVGLAFTFALVLPAPRVSGSVLADLYLGRIAQPQWGHGRVDAKMFLYLVGAVMLELNLLSFAAHHALVHRADPSPGVALYVGLFTFFLCEYLFFEEVHLYTYDFVAERVGFKLGWGCLVFYPFFYGVGLWGVADRPSPHTPTPVLVACAAVFFTGWALARGANLQKFYFKTRPGRRVFGIVPQVALEGGGKRVLVSGFWGLSRHVNYLGEMLMATALALSLGHPRSVWPWLYPLYYVALLVPRQHADDKRCAEKYGALWDEYRRRVPYRIIPWVY